MAAKNKYVPYLIRDCLQRFWLDLLYLYLYLYLTFPNIKAHALCYLTPKEKLLIFRTCQFELIVMTLCNYQLIFLWCRFPHQKNDWTNAQNVCRTQGANLFNPRTKYQNNNVSIVAEDLWGFEASFWIGINDIGE